jgi:hypothetical protein
MTVIRMFPERRILEAKALFGRSLVRLARMTDPADLELTAETMDAVHDAADELLEHAGDPRAQGRVVAALNPQTRLLLCMWVIDLSLGANLARRAIYATTGGRCA